MGVQPQTTPTFPDSWLDEELEEKLVCQEDVGRLSFGQIVFEDCQMDLLNSWFAVDFQSSREMLGMEMWFSTARKILKP